MTLCAARRLEAAGFGAMDVCAYLQDMRMSCGTVGHFACSPWFSMLEPACRALHYVFCECMTASLGSMCAMSAFLGCVFAVSAFLGSIVL